MIFNNEIINRALSIAEQIMYCDKLLCEYEYDDETLNGVVKLCFNKDKHIDDHIIISDKLRLHDLLRAMLWDYVECIEFDSIEECHSNKFDIIQFVIWMELKNE